MTHPPNTRVLLISSEPGDDPRRTEHYTELIREVAADAQIDLIERADGLLSWLSRLNYNLVVICSGGPVDALSVLEMVKRVSPVTAVLIVSENAKVEEAVAAVRMGAEDYLARPLNLEAFRLAVKRGLDRKHIFGDSKGAASSFLHLLNSCQMISASLEQGRIFAITRSYFARELKSDHVGLYTLQDGNPVRVSESPDEAHRDRVMEEIMEIALHASNALTQMSEAKETMRFIDRGQLTPAMFVFRFTCVGLSEFFCVCLAPERPQQLEAFESRLRMLRTQIELTGKNIEQYQGVQHLVYVDDATGLYNTRYLSNILDREIVQSQQSGRPFAVLFMDGDRFKSINDSHGHLAGTKLLYELGSQLKRFVRDRDTVFRYGGDEFVAVLSGCDLKTAETVAERIRASVEAHEFLKSENVVVKITVSIGVALYPEHARSKKAIIDAADHAMYSAKKRSRNSVFVSEPLAPPPAPVKPGPTASGLATDVQSKMGSAKAGRSPSNKERRNK